ncbi:hypothetical protein IEQ34_024330 [Dendrobium chrysotoxum]|uniref:Uncharacterized protein n=1 Tax=Dendrobium chrysotoxum TaxID=161865 RepID=A0AAV7FTZ2_DENCH|nr:hypothetical protein IEQ34_024330 [Dendrobium chrysotoxum]
MLCSKTAGTTVGPIIHRGASCGCQVLEEMEIDLEDKWWLEEDHSLSPSEKGEEANSLPGKSCTKRVRPLPFKKGR